MSVLLMVLQLQEIEYQASPERNMLHICETLSWQFSDSAIRSIQKSGTTSFAVSVVESGSVLVSQKREVLFAVPANLNHSQFLVLSVEVLCNVGIIVHVDSIL